MAVSGLHARPAQEAGADTIRTGLFGRGILASRSPWMHEQEALAQGFALDYVLFDFDSLGWSDAQLAQHLNRLKSEGFAGVNVTHPFKQRVIPFLDDLADSAKRVGAVNTVKFANGKSIGHNTDMSGFAQSVRVGLAGHAITNVVQYGAGGAGAATAHALLSLGTSKLTLVEEDHTRGIDLAERLIAAYPDADILCGTPASTGLEGADGIVNATPVGMDAHPGAPFDPARLDLTQWVADIVYFPIETQLLRAARSKGCPTLDGKGMAVFQAADAFEIFSGHAADHARMLASFDAYGADKAVSAR